MSEQVQEGRIGALDIVKLAAALSSVVVVIAMFSLPGVLPAVAKVLAFVAGVVAKIHE